MLSYASFTATSFLGLVRAKRPDYVFVESPPLFLSIPGWIAARYWRVPMVFNVADLWPDSVRELGILREGLVLRLAERLERWTYRRASYVNVVTEGIRNVLVEKKAVPEQKVLFLPNGVDTELFKPQEPDEEIIREWQLQDKKVILYAGTLGYAQGLDVALDAMKLIQTEIPEALLVFVGDGSDKERLVRRAKEERMSNVRFIPPHPPEYVARLYSTAYAGFASLKRLPLFEGARPSKLFPIMASGKPVLYSGSGEAARLIEQARAGLIAPPENPHALAEAMRILLQRPELAQSLGLNGRQYAEAHFSWNSLVQDWLVQLTRGSSLCGLVQKAGRSSA